MGDRIDSSSGQFRADRPAEQEAVRTTIVGGRPPGSGKTLGDIPRGIEVLVKKAAVDPEFRATLLARRADAAAEIGLALDPAEATMLSAVPARQLEAIIDRTGVPAEHRRVFLGKVAAAMLATMGLSTAGCPIQPQPAGIRPEPGFEPPMSEGIRPDLPEEAESSPPETEGAEPPAAESGEPEGVIRGTRPERVPVTEGIRPDDISPPKGVRPERPPIGTEGGSRPELPPEGSEP
jgi:hypothetical protein